jgi:hypothetical protein
MMSEFVKTFGETGMPESTPEAGVAIDYGAIEAAPGLWGEVGIDEGELVEWLMDGDGVVLDGGLRRCARVGQCGSRRVSGWAVHLRGIGMSDRAWAIGECVMYGGMFLALLSFAAMAALGIPGIIFESGALAKACAVAGCVGAIGVVMWMGGMVWLS